MMYCVSLRVSGRGEGENIKHNFVSETCHLHLVIFHSTFVCIIFRTMKKISLQWSITDFLYFLTIQQKIKKLDDEKLRARGNACNYFCRARAERERKNFVER